MFCGGRPSRKSNFLNWWVVEVFASLLNHMQGKGPPPNPSNAHTGIGHSMSKGIKKMGEIFTGCCLLLPLIILIKLWNFHAKRVAGLWRWRARGDLEKEKTLSGSCVVAASFKLKANTTPGGAGRCGGPGGGPQLSGRRCLPAGRAPLLSFPSRAHNGRKARKLKGRISPATRARGIRPHLIVCARLSIRMTGLPGRSFPQAHGLGDWKGLWPRRALRQGLLCLLSRWVSHRLPASSLAV